MIKAAACVAIFGILSYYYYTTNIKYSTKLPSQLKNTYDYIVVGAGSAGAAVAAGLSEDSAASVLLLEAGSQGRTVPWSHIPGVPFLNQKTSIDWQFVTEPQKHACLGLKNKVSLWPRGKVLGGTSVINYMNHVRGSPEDYNYWADELGCSGWSFQDVIPYFKKMESATFGDPNYRGHSGPINAVVVPKTKYDEALLKAASAKGYPVIDDYNGPSEKGFSRFQMSTRNGWRSSTFAEYLFPIRSRANLHVVEGAMVTKVNINDERIATGVSYLHDGKEYMVKASKDVVLSSGAVQSPQLLMLSGVGPKEHLDSLNIPVYVDLPAVGKNLQDHLHLMLPFTVNESIGLDPTPLISVATAKNFFQWLFFGTGPFSWHLLGLHGMLESGLQPAFSKALPDIQIYFQSTDSFLGGMLADNYNMGEELMDAYYGNAKMKPMVTFLACLLQPKSSGEIRLRSSNPLEPPIIDPNYLSDMRDVKVMVRATKIVMDLANTEGMQKFALKSPELHTPGCEKHELWSDAYLICMVRHKTLTIYHPSSTCRMGPNQTNAVVDTRLRVFGVKNLRVADASVFPNIPSGNTNVPSTMIGERAAALIKEDWKHLYYAFV